MECLSNVLTLLAPPKFECLHQTHFDDIANDKFDFDTRFWRKMLMHFLLEKITELVDTVNTIQKQSSYAESISLKSMAKHQLEPSILWVLYFFNDSKECKNLWRCWTCAVKAGWDEVFFRFKCWGLFSRLYFFAETWLRLIPR